MYIFMYIYIYVCVTIRIQNLKRSAVLKVFMNVTTENTSLHSLVLVSLYICSHKILNTIQAFLIYYNTVYAKS